MNKEVHIFFKLVFLFSLEKYSEVELLDQRHLLFGRKAMTNLDRILKSRDITLRTKVHIVKAMVFPVVLSECESWTVKKPER